MQPVLFVLGCPGVGKSTVARHLAEYHAQRVNDQEILCQKFSDVAECKLLPSIYSNYNNFDFSKLDTPIDLLALSGQNRMAHLSRGENVLECVPDNNQSLLSNFSLTFIQDACFLFMNADTRTCLPEINDQFDYLISKDDFHDAEDTFYNSCHNDKSKRVFVHYPRKKLYDIHNSMVTIKNAESARICSKRATKDTEQNTHLKKTFFYGVSGYFVARQVGLR